MTEDDIEYQLELMKSCGEKHLEVVEPVEVVVDCTLPQDYLDETIFDCCKQSLKRLLHPPTQEHTLLNLISNPTLAVE